MLKLLLLIYLLQATVSRGLIMRGKSPNSKTAGVGKIVVNLSCIVLQTLSHKFPCFGKASGLPRTFISKDCHGLGQIHFAPQAGI